MVVVFKKKKCLGFKKGVRHFFIYLKAREKYMVFQKKSLEFKKKV